jgi:hypothetical protein
LNLTSSDKTALNALYWMLSATLAFRCSQRPSRARDAKA